MSKNKKSSRKAKQAKKLDKGNKKTKTATHRRLAVSYADDAFSVVDVPTQSNVARTRSEHTLLWSDGVLQQRQSLECFNVQSLKALTKEARDTLFLVARACITLDKCAGHEMSSALPALVTELQAMRNLPGGKNTVLLERTIHLSGEHR